MPGIPIRAALLLTTGGLGVVLAQGTSGPASLAGLQQAARQSEARGDFASAEGYYVRILREKEDAEILQRLGLVRHLQNKFHDAIEPLQRAVALDPKLWGSHLFLGIDYYRTNQFTKAIRHLEEADRLQPNHSEVQFWLGAAALAEKQYLRGFEVLERLSAAKPGQTEVLRLLAERYSEYATALDSSVAGDAPETPWGLLVHGEALELEGAKEAALGAYRQAVQLNPSLAAAQRAVGRLLWQRGNRAEAVAAFESAVECDPSDWESHYYLGLDRLAGGEAQSAISHLSVASRGLAGSEAPVLAYARALAANGDSAGASEAVRRAISIAPHSEEVHTAALTMFRAAGDRAAESGEERRWAAGRR